MDQPILVAADGGILAGHARLLAARQLGMDEVPVIVLGHLTEAQRRALVIADNALGLNGGWSEELLRLELQALQEVDFDLTLVGFEDAELELLLAAQDAAEGLTDEDYAPALAEQPVSRTGELWTLGNHKLLVGDCTNQEDVARLMGGDLADMVFTDAPYNVGVVGYTEQELTIQNDSMSVEQFTAFLNAAFTNLRSASKLGASLYVCHGSIYQREFQNALEQAGFEIRCQIIWVKNTFAWGFGRYKFQHEPIFYAHVKSQKDPWYGNKSQSTTWLENKPAANRIHPTMKPVELIERALINSSKTGDIVVDMFAGSGSTLIGCERRSRRARLMEIDPKYADCILRRYQAYSGKQAVLDGDGRSYDALAADRLHSPPSEGTT